MIIVQGITVPNLKICERLVFSVKGGGGGGGVHPDYFVKLNFEIAVDQQTRARDQTFEGVPGDHRCLRDSNAHIGSICGPNLSNDLNMFKTMIWGALLVATSLLNTCI